ncbi:GNAT family N-acetyltransferase [Paenibacillus physcomitrellae]|uniref:GNAT family N-acetyltransferase n=1 Tax=Paenibacillus physcomitrellae TaxID=1619311 RepID=UPI0012FD2130|nr:GNAT family N-acetyltransferase [Paenibacillus physcomitrellae]
MTNPRIQILTLPDRAEGQRWISQIAGVEMQTGGSLEFVMRGFGSPGYRSAFMALQEDQIAGMAVSWKAEFHPFCTYVAMAITPDSLEEAGRRLLDEIVKRSEEPGRPLQTSIRETESKLASLYSQYGFQEVRRTYLTALPLELVCDSRFELEIDQTVNLPQHYEIINMSVLLSGRPHLTEELVRLVKRYYEATHTVNPPGEFALERWEQLCFSEDVVLEGSYVVITKHGIAAYAFLHKTDQPEALELGWRGTRDAGSLPYSVLLASLQIRFALDHGYKQLEAEIDTTDPCAMAMFERYPFSREAALITYQNTIHTKLVES